eukprot:1097349-Karenia_brevis.AAC.1
MEFRTHHSIGRHPSQDFVTLEATASGCWHPSLFWAVDACEPERSGTDECEAGVVGGGGDD